MRILLDECVDRRLAKDIVGHEVKTVHEMGWAGMKNGELIVLAEREFDVLVTTDRNLSSQQNLPRFNIAVAILTASSNRLKDLQPLVPKLLRVLPSTRRGEAVWVSI